MKRKLATDRKSNELIIMIVKKRDKNNAMGENGQFLFSFLFIIFIIIFFNHTILLLFYNGMLPFPIIFKEPTFFLDDSPPLRLSLHL